MTFYLADDPKPGPANPAPAPNAGTMEVLGAAWDAESIESDAWQRSDRVRREVVGEIEARIGSFEADTPVEAAPDVTEFGLEPQYQSYAENDTARRPFVERQVLARAGRFAAQRPADYGGLPLDEAQLEAEVNRRLRAEWEEDQAVLQAGGFGSGLAEFGARAARASTDEFGLAFMLAGGPGTGVGLRGAARFIGVEAGLGAAGEAFVLPRQYEMADRLGIPEPDALTQIALGAVGSAGLAGLGVAAQRGWTYAFGRAAGEAEARPAGADPIEAQVSVDEAEAALRDGRPVPMPAPVAPGDFDGVAGRIVGVESGGNASAKNPASSATGAGQFIDGTWLAMIRKHRPDLAEGRSAAEILALRGDGRLSREMTEAYARDNAALLAAEGLPTDDGSLYLAHFAGPGTAARVLRGDPGAPVSSVLTPEAIRANRNIRYGGKFLPDFTLGDLRRWAEVKMGQAQDPGTSWRSSTSAGYTSAGQVTTPAGTRIDVAYEVVDASTLIPASGNLQPRDRSRASSDEQIAGIAARLDPARLMPSPETDRGAPLVGPDNVIESGNGRVRSIVRAAAMHPDRMDAYRAAIAEVAPIPEGVETPVLIARRTTELDDASRVRLVQESNTSAIARMSATEQAGMDGSVISAADLALYDPRLPLTNPGNRAFTMAALGRLPQAERAGLVDAEGRLNAAGSRRLREALVARAYDAPDMTRILAEDDGGDLRGLLEALGDVAPRWAMLRDEVAAGNLQPELDATDQLVEALRIIARARAAARATPGLSVRGALEEALAQVDAFTGAVDAVTRRFVDVYYRPGGPRSQADVAALLNRYVDEAFRVGDTQQRLFAETGGATPEEVLDAIRAEDPDAARGAGPVAGDAGGGEAPARSGSGDRGAGSGGDGGDVPPSGGDGAAPERGPFGPILREYAGDPQGAIARLMADQTGEAVGALGHPEVPEPISLVWGDKGDGRRGSGAGLAKIADRHPEVLPDLQGMFSAATQVVSRTDNRIRLESDDYYFVVSRDFKGAPHRPWLLTAFGKEKQGAERSMGRSSGSPEASSASALPASKDTPAAPAVQGPDIRLADDADFGAGSASPLVDAANRSALADLRAQLDATGDFEIATGALVDTPEGKRPETVSARALLDELEDQQDLAEVISACTLGGRRDV